MTVQESRYRVNAARQLSVLNEKIVACRRCPRLVEHREHIARVKRRAYRHWQYWGRALPGFGDPRAQLLILGLAPAAHGANRTGRMFTGDRSGEFLYRGLYEAGFASQPHSTHRDDGLQLKNAYISAVARCAPPENKPSPQELRTCRPYLEAELDLLRPRVVLALGAIAFACFLKLLEDRGEIPRSGAYRFSHGAEVELLAPLPRLFASYHPSQQNTQTGRLTPAMFQRVLKRIVAALVETS